MPEDVPCLVSESEGPESDAALRGVYGEDAKFSRIGPFTLVHLDDPPDSVVAERTSGFDPDEYFFDGCPLCEAAKASGGHIVFDSSSDERFQQEKEDSDSE